LQLSGRCLHDVSQLRGLLASWDHGGRLQRRWSTAKYRAQQLRVQSERAQRRSRDRAPRGPAKRRRAPETIVLTAPSELSVFDFPEQTLAFCDSLFRALSGSDTEVVVDLRPVTRFSSDALLLMRAVMSDDVRGVGSSVRGSFPLDANVASKIKESGFFNGFARVVGPLPKPNGLILKKSHRSVHSEIAAELVRFAVANTKVSRQVANACSNTLVEAMTNTHNHARNDTRRRITHRTSTRPWFASVYCEEGVASFTFVDLGVGVLNSGPTKAFLRLLPTRLSVALYGRVKLMEDVFRGLVGSSTGLPGRGLGLPRMKSDCDAGLLPGLKVMSSSVLGDVGTLNFRELPIGTRGTVLRWRIGQEAQGN
jgi:hypothetical protein